MDQIETRLLSGDTALVTGAGMGIGRAIAEALAREGARVVLTDVAVAEGEVVATALASSGADVAFIAADLRDAGAPAVLVEQARQHFGCISILVHCASPQQRQESMENLTEEAFDEMLDVNVRAGFRLARLLGQQMCDEAIQGSMLFITSLHAKTPRQALHYSVAKAGLTMLMKEIATALGPHGIRVNAIAPGYITDGWWKEAAALTEMIPLRRMSKPSELAQLAVALLSNRFGSYVHGTTITVDGGLSLHNWLSSSSRER